MDECTFFTVLIYKKSTKKRVGLSHPSIVPYGCFKTKDNVNILFSIQNEREWKLLDENVLNLSDKLKKRFNSPSLRLKNKSQLNNLVKKKN